MKHFHEAIRDSIGALKDAAIIPHAERLCLIIDLEGRFRLLVQPVEGTDAAALEASLQAALPAAAGHFWTGEVWFETEATSKADQAIFETVWREGQPEADDPKVHVLHRRVSKDWWFDQSTDAPWPLVDEGRTPPILAFYSYKGGVGRSTALASIALQEARSGKRVVVIDFDLEAPGLGSMFPPPGEAASQIGVVDYLLEKPVVGEAFPFDDLYYTYDDPRAVGDQGGEVRVIPAGWVDGDYLEKLARVNYQKLSGADGESVVNGLLRQVRTALTPDVVLIDSRAGLHDMGGLALSPIAHRHVLFGLDSEQSWRGISLAIRHLGAERILCGRPQQDCLLVQSMASPNQEIREASQQRFLERSYEGFSEHFYDAAETPDAEYPVPDLQAPDQPHFPVVLKHSEEVMGYDSVADAADALCRDDYAALWRRLLPR